MGWLVLDNGLQLGDMADALGQALSKEHLGPDLQVLWVLYEPEENYCLLPGSQLFLQDVQSKKKKGK